MLSGYIGGEELARNVASVEMNTVQSIPTVPDGWCEEKHGFTTVLP